MSNLMEQKQDSIFITKCSSESDHDEISEASSPSKNMKFSPINNQNENSWNYVKDENLSVDHDEVSDASSPSKKMKFSPINNENENSWKCVKNENLTADFPSGKLTLWQFLLELLMCEEYSHLIKWTDRNIGEFILIQAEEVAKLWGIRKDRNHRMNYDKLSRALRYYYQKNIIKKVHGHKFVYRFVSILPDMLPFPMNNSTINGNNINSQLNINTCITKNEQESLESNSPKENNIPTPNLLFNNHSNTTTNSLPSSGLLPTNKDFNSTITALFQAAVMSIGQNNSIINQAQNSRISSPTQQQPQQHLMSHHDQTSNDCVCHNQSPNEFTQTLPATTNTNLNRQSLLHFNRHSINMQRLSQEILLHSSSNTTNPPTNISNKPRTNSNNQPTCIDGKFSNKPPSYDYATSQMWFNQFAQNLLSSVSTSTPNSNKSNSNHHTIPTFPNNNEHIYPVKTEEIPKIEPSPDESNSLLKAFNNFMNELKKRAAPSTVNVSQSEVPISLILPKSEPEPIPEYSHVQLLDVIRSQLESKPNYVWMPIPSKFAEYFVNSSTILSNNFPSSSLNHPSSATASSTGKYHSN